MEEASDNGCEQEVDKNVSIRALSYKTKNHLSLLLNPRKILPTDHGRKKGQELDRYWRGLACLCELDGKYRGEIENSSDMCGTVLKLWQMRDPDNSTVEKLLGFLEEIDRFDVIDDLHDEIEEDLRVFARDSSPYRAANLAYDKEIITSDDVQCIQEGGSPQLYDAFVLFVDEDIVFATKLIDTMEQQYGMKLCTKERDLVGGSFEFDAIMKLITDRCARLIVILSTAFFESNAAKFFVQFAQSIGIENSQRKVIPCVYTSCRPLPKYLSYYFLLDYTRAGQLWNFWDKLRDSIRTPTPDKLARSHSDNTQAARRSQANSNLRPILHHSNHEPKSLNHGVQFSSMVNLNSPQSENILIDNSLSTSTSANSLDLNHKHQKKNKNWLKWFKLKNNNLKHVQQQQSDENITDNNSMKVKSSNSIKEKKKLTLKLSMKRKATALVAN